MRKQLSQQKLLEILCHEIDMLQETCKNINEIAPAIARQLHELKTTKLKHELNTERLEWLLANHEKTLKKSVVIPRWFLWLIGVVVMFLAIQGLWFNADM
jgi:tRNA A37 threonylcarbamoyladenosine synthetase subunit TsaC/SUA5/YrdC